MSEDRYCLLEGQKDGLPAVIVIDREAFTPERRGHQWHLSVMMDCQELADQGMPTREESLVLDREGDRVEAIVQATSRGIFMARVTCHGTRQLLFRVSDPAIVAKALQDEIARNQNERPWDFRMWEDVEWKEAEWYAHAIQAG